MRRVLEGKDKGFTLLEVLVAVGLLAMLSGLMYQAMSLTFRARETIARIEDLNHCAQVALHHLTRDISMAFLSNHVDPLEPKTITLFDGEESSILFTYLGHERRQRGAKESDQGVVEYRLERDPDGSGTMALVRREKPLLDAEPERGGTKEVLVSGVKEFTLKYWDDNAEDWRDEWKVYMEDALKGGIADNASPAIAPVGAAVTKAMQEQILERFRLPSRVYIRLVLEDSEGYEFAFETQTRIHLRAPLNF